MTARRKEYDREARRLMGMSGVMVYERRTGPTPIDWSFDIVWGGKRQWSVPFPWEENKHVLRDVGISLRNDLYVEEQFEKSLHAEEKLREHDENEHEQMAEDMVRDTKRIAVDRPVYFYNR